MVADDSTSARGFPSTFQFVSNALLLSSAEKREFPATRAYDDDGRPSHKQSAPDFFIFITNVHRVQFVLY